jgi:hypothetical protein
MSVAVPHAFARLSDTRDLNACHASLEHGISIKGYKARSYSEFKASRVVKESATTPGSTWSSPLRRVQFSRVPSSQPSSLAPPPCPRLSSPASSSSAPNTRHSHQLYEPSIPQTYKRNMATRAFVVFRDEPSKPLSKTDVSISPSSLVVQPTILVLSPGTPLTTAEKENLHPSTGTRSGVIADPQSKKRKNGVLTTKLHIPPTVKKQRDSALDGRKRKTTSTSSSSKGSKVTTSGAPELPKVEEVVEPEPCNRSKVTQAEVDSRCYDLTVSPLADVSHAFDQVSLSPTESRLDNTRILSPKVGSRLFIANRRLIYFRRRSASVKRVELPYQSLQPVLSPPQRRPLVMRACFRPQSGSKFTLLLHSPRHRHHQSALQALISTFLGISDLIPNPLHLRIRAYPYLSTLTTTR